MLGSQLGGNPLYLDKGDQFAVDTHAVVRELPFDLVLGSKVGVLVETEPLAQEVRHQETGVALVGVPGDKIRKWLAEPADGSLQSFPCFALPLGDHTRRGPSLGTGALGIGGDGHI